MTSANFIYISLMSFVVLQILLNMGHAIVPFVQPLFPVFMTSLKDEDDEVKSNTIYGLGLLAFFGGDIILPYPW